jgi:hypothetical protein
LWVSYSLGLSKYLFTYSFRILTEVAIGIIA